MLMLRILVLALWLAPAAFLASPLTADDLYGAPDPGWYNAGSGYRPDTGRSDAGDWYGADTDGGYHYDAFRRDDRNRRFGGARPQAGGYAGWERRVDDGYGAEDGYGYLPADPTESRRRNREPADRVSPNGYGAPDWAQEPLPEYVDRPDSFREPDYSADIYAAPRRQQAGDGYSDWRAPPARPRYRFRDDPDLEQQAGGGVSGYRFRPLTRREQERHREASRDGRFADPWRDESRYRPRDRDERGTAFGYAPAPGAAPQDDFYRRYYRSGP
jgi:hypothetical protein